MGITQLTLCTGRDILAVLHRRHMQLRKIMDRQQARAVGSTRYFGRVCQKHPHLGGERLTSEARCVACHSERVAANRKRNNPARKAALGVRYFGRVCGKHPELMGERLTGDRKCVGCIRTQTHARQRGKFIPAWADMAAIQRVYAEASHRTKNTGIEHHVDHIVPVNGLKVCGLHVHNNLRVMSGAENIAKGNKYDC